MSYTNLHHYHLINLFHATVAFGVAVEANPTIRSSFRDPGLPLLYCVTNVD